MADSVICDALLTFFPTEAAVMEVYQKAWAAYSERATEVVITSANFVEGSSSGQIAGDPKELMGACKHVLTILNAEWDGETLAQGPVHTVFSAMITET